MIAHDDDSHQYAEVEAGTISALVADRSAHLLSFITDRAWCTSPCRCSTFLLYTHAEPCMSSAAARNTAPVSTNLSQVRASSRRCYRGFMLAPPSPSAKLRLGPPSKEKVMCSKAPCRNKGCQDLGQASMKAAQQLVCCLTRYSSRSLAMLMSQLAARSRMGCSRCLYLHSSSD